MDELVALKAELAAANMLAGEHNVVAEELQALKAQLAAANSSLSKQNDLNQGLRDQLQALETELAARVPLQQLTDTTVYIPVICMYVHRLNHAPRSR